MGLGWFFEGQLTECSGIGARSSVRQAYAGNGALVPQLEIPRDALSQTVTITPVFSPSVCPAEDLPFGEASVDLVTAFAAAHWFDMSRFMKEVDRILKPSGCVVFSSYTSGMHLHYKDCSEKLTEIFMEVS